MIIAAERKRQTVEELLTSVAEAFGEVEIARRIGGEQAPRASRCRLPICLSAIEQGYAIATLNLRHFQTIPSLRVMSF
jgi:hypothetical protein